MALAVRADGVHIGQSDMAYADVIRIIPSSMLVGLSVENMQQAMEAANLHVDYLGVSPVLATSTKTNFQEKPWGLEGLQKLRSVTSNNLVAIGGINLSNVADVIKAGADGIAVVSAICSAPDPKNAASELIKKVQQGK